jgi:hypothetical protein
MTNKAAKPLPAHIQQYAFDFRWDNQLLWNLDVEVESMRVEDLLWHFDIPWLHTEGERFNLTPKDIMQHPVLYQEQYERTMQSDLTYPIDVMENKGRWLILDGLHRLMKAVHNGENVVTVRKIPRAFVSRIEIH